MPNNCSILFLLDIWYGQYCPCTLVQGFKAPSTLNVSELLDLNDHIKTKLMSKPEGRTCMNNSALEPVLFKKLHNIKLSCLVFRVTTFFQFKSTKAAIEILLQYTHDFEKNLKTVYSKLLTNNEFDYK